MREGGEGERGEKWRELESEGEGEKEREGEREGRGRESGEGEGERESKGTIYLYKSIFVALTESLFLLKL